MVLFWSGIAWAAETGWISPMVLFWLLDETWIVYSSTVVPVLVLVCSG